MSFREEFANYEKVHGTPGRIELLLPDINAVLRGKWLPGTDAAKLDDGGVRLPISTYAPNILGQEIPETGLGAVVGDPDGVIVPVAGSLRRVPWLAGHVAQVQVEMRFGKDAISHLSTRARLAAMQERLAARGLRAVVATELEFYLFRPRQTADQAPRPPEFSPGTQNYEMNVLDRLEPVLTAIGAASAAQNLATDTLIAEFGPGQFEINFHHTSDILTAADTALLFRRLVRGVAQAHGLDATFMAKPYGGHPGNGMHVHASMIDASGANIFDDIFDDGPNIAPTLRHAVAGVLATMPEMQAVFAPHLNSYRRFRPGHFSPSRPDWGRDHRGAAIRLPDISGPAARLEHRISGADVNPYLVLTAVLGGMLHGLDKQPALPPALDDPDATPAPPLAQDWRQAIDRFAASSLAADLFGTALRDIFVTLKLDEIDRLTAEITPAEYRTYLGRL